MREHMCETSEPSVSRDSNDSDKASARLNLVRVRQKQKLGAAANVMCKKLLLKLISQFVSNA